MSLGRYVFVFLLCSIEFLLCIAKLSLHSHYSNDGKTSHNKKFFVNGPSCKMPQMDPFSADIMKFFKRRQFRKCCTDKDLVVSEFDSDLRQYRIKIDEHLAEQLLKKFHNATLKCTYQVIGRNKKSSFPDKDFSLSKAQTINQSFVVPKTIDFIFTQCHAVIEKTEVKLLQKDAFLFVQDRLEHRQKDPEDPPPDVESKPNVIILGIDSTSRMNLRRSMPKVHKFLQRPGWFEMQGYNEVGENTLPNLLALLTGNAEEKAKLNGRFRRSGFIDKLKYIWQLFKQNGYMTAFGEDSGKINAFDNHNPGFKKQPVDYYLRNFIVALESILKTRREFGNVFCLGRKLAFKYLSDFAMQFMQRFQNAAPVFGIFWSNSFTHEDFLGATALDQVFLEYLLLCDKLGFLDRSIVIVLSDHGYKNGVSRQRSKSGYLEERLPIMFIHVPPWFRMRYPQYVENLKINQNRLSSSFDLHLTLHHLLQLNATSMADFSPKLQASQCKSCQSLFFQLPYDRNCSQAGIGEKWCSCEPTETVTNQVLIKKVAREVVRHMNEHLRNRNLTKLCQNYTLKKVLYMDGKLAPTDDSLEDDQLHTYIITFDTNPTSAHFEATVQWNMERNTLTMNMDELSRLESYDKHSKCTRDPIVKKYCICKSFK
ncbi:uncharacterized protein LOC122617190 [Drosophila teissieri]|uniref:uncharacterized protein LOC122617190 n=1 Tax=Drosophila teissieri TaxID=7243 RepID=UPI001CBA37F8|nr:uncharacterized protein LOC122617190 [Drosophila teissieri]